MTFVPVLTVPAVDTVSHEPLLPDVTNLPLFVRMFLWMSSKNKTSKSSFCQIKINPRQEKPDLPGHHVMCKRSRENISDH